MASHSLGGVTVDAVREQLKQLGHEDVSDSVIREFLSQLSVDASRFASPSAPAEAAAGPSTSTGPVEDAETSPSKPRRIARTTSAAARARASSGERRRDLPGGNASPATAVAPTSARSTRAVHVRGRIPTVPSPPARTPPRAPRGDAVDATPKSTRRTPRGSVAASPPSSSSATLRTPRGSHSASPSARTPPSATSKLFGTAPRFAYSRSTPDPEPPRRAFPGELRRVAPSAPAAPNRSGGCVIRAPTRVRGCTPGQAYRIDRVARNRAYQEAWNRDAFLSSKENRGAAGLGPTATAAVVPRRRENFQAAVQAARETNRRNVDAASGRGRTQAKLTSSFGRVGNGAGRDGRGSAAFATPDSKRRDDVRWEIRRMMAEPPTF